MRWQTLREAKWILATLFILLIGGWFIHPWFAVPWLLLIAFTIAFFRDPDRAVPPDAAIVVAAADGRVVEIEEMIEPEFLKKPMVRVAIFLSVFNVHTNRAPITGKVTYRQYRRGKFLDARNPECSQLNEAMTWAFENSAVTLVVRQITGAIARRIVAWSKTGDHVEKGERFGMIRFGSRTEIYVPVGSEIVVKVGDTVQGGSSVIARLV